MIALRENCWIQPEQRYCFRPQISVYQHQAVRTVTNYETYYKTERTTDNMSTHLCFQKVQDVFPALLGCHAFYDLLCVLLLHGSIIRGSY
jgi:hypothetical protein